MICFICTKQLNREEWAMQPHRAIEFEYHACFGSEHDGDVGVIYICDTCYGQRIDRVFAFHNYIDEEE
jgi:hypothetical protein